MGVNLRLAFAFIFFNSTDFFFHGKLVYSKLLTLSVMQKISSSLPIQKLGFSYIEDEASDKITVLIIGSLVCLEVQALLP